MDYFADWTWQDYLVAVVLIMAASFLWRTRIAPRFRRESSGCDKCAAKNPSILGSSKTQTVKLSDEKAEEMRREIGADGSNV